MIKERVSAADLVILPSARQGYRIWLAFEVFSLSHEGREREVVQRLLEVCMP